MDLLLNIILGFQIGLCLSAAYLALRIAYIEITPSFPYIIATINLALMATMGADSIFMFLPLIVKVLIQAIIATLWMIFFAKIYSLIKRKIK